MAMSGKRPMFADTKYSVTKQPDQQRYYKTDDDHRRYRNVKSKIVPLNDDIAGQTAEGQGADPGPGEPDQGKSDADCD
jgi:hypothetical protein